MFNKSTEVKDTFWYGMNEGSGFVLDYADHITEILTGLLLALTFTCSMSVATNGDMSVRTVLWSALTCNIAWGIFDGALHLLGSIISKGAALVTVKKIRNAPTEIQADRYIKEYLPPFLTGIMSDEHFDHLRTEVKKLPEPPARMLLSWGDIKGSIHIFILVFISTFPPTVPFILIEDLSVAMRVSNAISLAIMFTAGYFLGKKTDNTPFRMGFWIMLCGVLLVLITMILGG
jgi:hypothetical protein